MAQTRSLIKALKKQLKANGRTYANVAELLQLSEASVKRLFASENISLQRFEAICQMLDMDISELIQHMLNDQHRVTQLSHEQEEKITSDLLLLLITVCVINGYSYDDIFEQYNIDAQVCLQKLTILDQLKIINLLPDNRIKLLVAANFSWLPNGPIQRFFQEKVEQDFFSSSFQKETEKLIVLNGFLSGTSNAALQKKMRRLANDFNKLSQSDKALPVSSHQGTSLVIALRPWQYSLFEDYQR